MIGRGYYQGGSKLINPLLVMETRLCPLNQLKTCANPGDGKML